MPHLKKITWWRHATPIFRFCSLTNNLNFINQSRHYKMTCDSKINLYASHVTQPFFDREINTLSQWKLKTNHFQESLKNIEIVMLQLVNYCISSLSYSFTSMHVIIYIIMLSVNFFCKTIFWHISQRII